MGDIDPGFEEFVHATGGRLHRTALLLCGEHHLAEDLTQVTYAKLFVRWRRIRTMADPLAYARTTLTRTYLSHRRLRRSAEQPAATLPEYAVEGDPTARLDLLSALRELAHDDRTVLVLRYWEDLSVAETAGLLHISEAAVRTRSSRALARLRTTAGIAVPEETP